MATAFSPNFTHAVFAARLGRRCFYAVALHPGWGALFFWAAWRVLTAWRAASDFANPVTHIISSECTPVGDLQRGMACAPGGGAGEQLFSYEHKMPRLDAVLGDAADGAYYLGLALAFVALVLGVISVLSTPTHRYGRDGVLRPVGRGLARPTLARRAAGSGMYRRIKAGHGAIASDWRASKGSHQELNKRLARVGRWRLKRWGRQWAREDAMGAVHTNPRRLDRWLIRRVDPPKSKLGRKTAQRRADRKQAKRVDRKAGPADYPGDDLVDELPPPPPRSPDMPKRPHLDPNDGPPQPPKPSTEIAAAARRASSAPANGHHPTPAPSPHTPGATVTKSHPEAEAVGLIFNTRNRVEADEHIREQARQRDHSRPEPVRFSYCQTCRTEVLGATCESCGTEPSHRGIR